MKTISFGRALLILAAAAAIPTLCQATGRLLQVGTLSSLLEGVYDGSLPMDTVQRPQAYGLGTFDKLDGEMVVLGGVVYRVGVDGAVTKPALTMTIPFASVSSLEAAELEEDIGPAASLKTFEAFLLSRLPSLNYPTLIVVKGEFANVRTRSVPAQAKPYRALAEVAATSQAVFELGARKGTLVGFYFPRAFAGLNAPGFHLHFLSDELDAGGHVLELELKAGHLTLQSLTSMQLILPGLESSFAISDLEPAQPAAKIQGE